MTAEAGRPLTLQEVADQLGVHYMTVYRYVRLGLLEASKVAGTWQVTPAALAELRDRSARWRRCRSAAAAGRHGPSAWSTGWWQVTPGVRGA